MAAVVAAQKVAVEVVLVAQGAMEMPVLLAVGVLVLEVVVGVV
jgi:hypothetical protein